MRRIEPLFCIVFGLCLVGGSFFLPFDHGVLLFAIGSLFVVYGWKDQWDEASHEQDWQGFERE